MSVVTRYEWQVQPRTVDRLRTRWTQFTIVLSLFRATHFTTETNVIHSRMSPPNAPLPVLRSRAFVESIENPFYPRGDMAAYNITRIIHVSNVFIISIYYKVIALNLEHKNKTKVEKLMLKDDRQCT